MKYEETKKIKKFEVRSTKKRNFSNLQTSYFRLQRGVAIYLAVIVMVVLLGIGLGLSTLLIGQIRIISGMGDSVVALYAADTGVERDLYENKDAPPPYGPNYGFLDIDGDGTVYDPLIDTCPDTVLARDADDACYQVTATDCAGNKCVESIGIYKGMRRAIEVSWSLLEPPPCQEPAQYTVFVSSVSYSASAFGDGAGADSLCQSLAGGAGLSGSYTAWLSNGTADEPRDRGLSDCAAAGINSASWFLPDGITSVADNWTDLIDGTIANPIDQNEIGGGQPTIFAWTATDQSGIATTENCSNWTNTSCSHRSSANQARQGDTRDVAATWSNDGNTCCALGLALYCFQHSL